MRQTDIRLADMNLELPQGILFWFLLLLKIVERDQHKLLS